MEKKRATMYMPTQKKNEFQPPMAERADLGRHDIILVFQGFRSRHFFLLKETTRTGDCKG